jgi:hypothetical protein
MNNNILKYKDGQIQKLNKIIKDIENLKNQINNKYNLIERNNKYLTQYYTNLFKTFIVFKDIPNYVINENASKFQFNKNFFIKEGESNNTFSEIARATLETFETCNLYQLAYYPEINIDETLYEFNTNNKSISSMIQLKDGSIAIGHYDNKKVSFYDYKFQPLGEIGANGNVSCICELKDNLLAVGMYSPNNIIIYDISGKNKGEFKEIKTLQGLQGKLMI